MTPYTMHIYTVRVRSTVQWASDSAECLNIIHSSGDKLVGSCEVLGDVLYIQRVYNTVLAKAHK